ncbi:MAG TPA: hypothetical protein VN256_24150 [Pyrinomonadaceae bacterium]|nr:hypothetical protein [Pyrinomonadaceae bacterium]
MLNQMVSFSLLILQAPAREPTPESASSPLLSGPFVLGLVLGIVIGALAALVFKMSRSKAESAQTFSSATNSPAQKSVSQNVKSVGQQIKRCPTCHSTYTDEALAYCVSDGAALVVIGNRPPAGDPNATMLYTPPRQTD